MIIAQLLASMHPIIKKKTQITLTVLGFINASIQWQNYHRWLEFWSLFERENNNRIDGKYMNVVSIETCIFVREKKSLSVTVAAGGLSRGGCDGEVGYSG